MDVKKILEIRKFAARIRKETVECIGARGFGHIGGALSVADLLAVLYSGIMKIDPKNPAWPERDKLVMSKGHAGPALYSALALKGYFPMDWLKTLNRPGTRLPSHCDQRLTPGIDMTTGSLGQGVSTAIGLALAQKMDGLSSRTYLVTGDGELDEGQVWEGALFAPNHGLSNLTWFVDRNHKQLDSTTEEVMALGNIAAKIEAFGWKTYTIDGRDVGEILNTLQNSMKESKKPVCIVLNTIKGAGIPPIEEIELNHHVVVEGELLEKSLSAINKTIEELEKEAVQ